MKIPKIFHDYAPYTEAEFISKKSTTKGLKRIDKLEDYTAFIIQKLTLPQITMLSEFYDIFVCHWHVADMLTTFQTEQYIILAFVTAVGIVVSPILAFDFASK